MTTNLKFKTKNSKTLYIIGNGFDLHHGLKTSYHDFAEYLRNNDSELYELLEKYIAFPIKGDTPTEDENLWGDFEENLANLDIDGIIHDNDVYLPNVSSDDFRERDLHTFPITMADIREKLTTDLVQNFQEFIMNVDYNNSVTQRLIELGKNALFLSFNYTNTLEKLYGINRVNIFYIHNNPFHGAGDIILGHGIKPENFEEQIEPPEDLTDEGLVRWIEKQNDGFDYSFDTGKENLYEYFARTYKPTNKIIKTNQAFFSNLTDIEEIFVFGHSLSSVDLPYFEEIIKRVGNSVKFTVSYWSSNKGVEFKRTLEDMGVKDITFIKLDELLIDNKQLKLDL